ncbi:MAG: hypothetical protein IK083_08850 [Abditibacteriota bacterium]|nr:hypothetical protein [Abditibacteriota bacterium]
MKLLLVLFIGFLTSQAWAAIFRGVDAPESKAAPAELQGRKVQGVYTGARPKKGPVDPVLQRAMKPGIPVKYEMYFSTGFKNDGTDAMILICDTLAEGPVKAMETLAREGKAPDFVAIGFTHTDLEPTLEGGSTRWMRKDLLDLATRDGVDFMTDEVLPALEKEHGYRVSPDPDMHYMLGGSSGAVWAWNACWYRNDYYRRCYLSSPTFSAINMGEEIPWLMRKMEPRPIKVVLNTGTIEPDDYFGASYPIALQTERALDFAGYDYKYWIFEGEGHCSRFNHYESELEFMEWIWKDWDTVPVTHPRICARLSEMTGGKEGWQEAPKGAKAPKKQKAAGPAGEYNASGGKIILVGPRGGEKVVAKGFGSISDLTVSSDRWKLYVADRNSNFVYSMSIEKDGSLSQLLKLCPLHKAMEAHRLGAEALCVAANDRIFCATELGVQCSISTGVVDVILPLPGDLPCDGVWLEGHTLWARSGKRLFNREINFEAKDPAVTTPAAYNLL